MSLEDVFVRDVLEKPEDDEIRLIYADWLSDQLAPAQAARGDFIRLQCQRARLPADDPDGPEMLALERELLAEYQADWVAGLADAVERWEFRRGFVEGITLTASSFLTRAERLFALGPIRQVNLRQAGPLLPVLARCQHLAAVTHLGLRENGPIAGSLPELAASPFLSGLTVLDLSRNPLSSANVQALVDSEALTSLKVLHLNGVGLDPAGVRAFFRGWSRTASTLGCGLIGRLTTLHLTDNPLGPEGASVLRDEMLWPVTDLDLSRTQLGVAGLLTLLADRRGWRRPLDRVQRLNLSGNDIAPSGAEALSNCYFLSSLTSLTLNHNGLADDGADALVGGRWSSSLDKLRELSLAGNNIGPTGMKALLGLRCLPRLTRLNLDNNTIGARGAELIASCSALGGLTDLNLGRNRLGPAGVENVLASASLTSLKRLDASGNGIGRRGVQALLDAPQLAGLVELNVSGNRLDEREVQRLRTRFGARLRV